MVVVLNTPLLDADGSFAGAILLAQDVTDWKRADEALRQQAERLQTLSRRLTAVQEEERRRIARELHDEIGQMLTGLRFVLEADPDLPAAAAGKKLADARSLVAPDALKNGALAYVPKGSATADLIRAVRDAAAGRRFLSPSQIAQGVGSARKPAAAAPLDPHETLTPREREVLQLAAEGNTSAAIAARLFLSPRTVEMHRANLMRKLGLKTPADLVLYALRRGVIPFRE